MAGKKHLQISEDEARAREVARLTRPGRKGELLEPQDAYAWPEIYAWPAFKAATPEAVWRAWPELATIEAVYALYVSRGQDAEALAAVAVCFADAWRVNAWLREALTRRAREQRISIRQAKRLVLMAVLPRLVAAPGAGASGEADFIEQVVQRGRRRMYDGDKRVARVIPCELHCRDYVRWLRYRAFALAAEDLLGGRRPKARGATPTPKARRGAAGVGRLERAISGAAFDRWREEEDADRRAVLEAADLDAYPNARSRGRREDEPSPHEIEALDLTGRERLVWLERQRLEAQGEPGYGLHRKVADRLGLTKENVKEAWADVRRKVRASRTSRIVTVAAPRLRKTR